MRLMLLVAALLSAPAAARADDPIQPGQMSPAFDRYWRLAGCAADFRSCHTVEVHAHYLPGSYHPGQEVTVTFENFQSVWLDGTTSDYTIYGGPGINAPECYLGGSGIASATLTGTFDRDNGGCGRERPNDWEFAPDATLRGTMVLNYTSQDYTAYAFTLHQVGGPFTTTPEPASVILVASGLVGVFAARRRRGALA